jgi:hypothetical protein
LIITRRKAKKTQEDGEKGKRTKRVGRKSSKDTREENVNKEKVMGHRHSIETSLNNMRKKHNVKQ